MSFHWNGTICGVCGKWNDFGDKPNGYNTYAVPKPFHYGTLADAIRHSPASVGTPIAI
jgi:hypothetical protein